ncbi:NAD(P)-dependent oxidoreductase, partial [Campylobacter jejuni]|nr:NAD(P)-dependent oxidoreductase [Campylobacter jejuni]
MKKCILVTGINGFLGSYLAKRLSNEYQVIGLKRSSSNCIRIKGLKNLIVYDIDRIAIKDIFNKHCFKAIFHTATCYGRKNEPLSVIVKANLLLGLELIENATFFN